MSRVHAPLSIPFGTSVQISAILWRWMYGHHRGAVGAPYWFPCMWNRGERSRYWQPPDRWLVPGDPFSSIDEPPGTPAPIKDGRYKPPTSDKILVGTVSWRRCEMASFGVIVGAAILQAGRSEQASGGEDGDYGYFEQHGSIRAYEVALNNPGARTHLVFALPEDVKP